MDRRSCREPYEGGGGAFRGRDAVRWEEAPEGEEETRGYEERRPSGRGGGYEERRPSGRSGGEEKKGIYGRAAGWVATHPSAALAAIIVLIVLVCVLVAMNRGAFGGRRGESLGRREAPAPGGGPGAKRGPAAPPVRPLAPPEETGDPETERLIESINTKQGI